MRFDGQRKHLALIAVSIVSLAGTVLFAQETGGAETAPTDGPERTHFITAEFKETSIRKVLDWIATRAGKTIVVEVGIEDRITVKFLGLHYLVAVEQVADLARCVVRQSRDRLIVEKPPRVTKEFKRADLGEVIHFLAEEAGANVVVDPGVKGEVTMRFSDVPWGRALSAVVKTSGYVLVEEDGGRILRVMEPSKLQASMEPRVFQFKHIRPDQAYRSKIAMGWMARPPATGESVRCFTLLDTLRNLLTRSVGAGPGPGRQTLGRIDYFKEQNCIVVVDTKSVLDQMEGLIRALDVGPEPAFLDATIVTTSNEDLIQMCTEWSRRDTDGFAVAPMVHASRAYPFCERSAPPGAPSKATGDTSLNDYDMEVILRLFAQDTDNWFEVRPNVSVQRRGYSIPVEIFVGEEIHYTDSPPSCSSSGALWTYPAPIQETSPAPGTLRITCGRCAGDAASRACDLYLISNQVVGTNKFILSVIPPDGRLTRNPSPTGGLEEFKAPSGGTTWEVGRCRLPVTNVAHVLVESGRTVVLAWPRPVDTCQIPRKLPYVRESSVLGRMFRRLSERVSRTRVFLFIHPHLVPAPSSPR